MYLQDFERETSQWSVEVIALEISSAASSPVETPRLAELVLPLVEAGHAQRVIGRDVCAKHLGSET